MTQPMDYVEYLSREIGARPAGTEEEQDAALYIADEFTKEAGFAASIEEFTSSSNLEGGRAILCMVTIVVSILAMLFNVLTAPALILAIIAAVIYVLEAYDRPVLSKLLARGASQNVVARYQPAGDEQNAKRGQRKRKIVLVAHYDTGKVAPGIVQRIESMGLPLSTICLGGMVAAAFFLLLRMFIGGTGGVGLIFINILTIISIVVVALPIVKAILYRAAPYNEGANNNATGVAALLEVAKRISAGSISEADLEADDVVMHGAQAAYDEGLVPEGTDFFYETDDAEIEANYSEEDRLLAAKAAIAALTGKPVEQRVYAPVSDGAGGREYDEFAEYADEPTTYVPSPTPAPMAELAPSALDQAVSAAVANVSAAAAANVPDEAEAAGFENAPSWFVAAQRNAKRTESSQPVQKSRYTEAIQAAERELAERDRARRELEQQQHEEARRAAISVMRAEQGQQAAMQEQAAMQDQAALEAAPAPAPAPEAAAEPAQASAYEAQPVEFAPTAGAQQAWPTLDPIDPDDAGQQNDPVQTYAASEEAGPTPASAPENDPASSEIGAEPIAESEVDLGQTIAYEPHVIAQALQRGAVQEAEEVADEPVAQPEPEAMRSPKGAPAKEARPNLAGLPPIDKAPAPAHVPENANPSRSGMFRMLRTDVPTLSNAPDEVDAMLQAPADQVEASKQNLGKLPQVQDGSASMAVAAEEPEVAADERKGGSPAAPAQVEMPKSRAGGFLNRLRKDKTLEDSPQEWLNVDEGFEAREVGRERGSWESFRNEEQDGGRTWEGGAFSRVRLGHVNTRSGEEESADEPEELVETVEDQQLNDEIEQIYHFRNPDYDAEIWFVAIGSDTELHDGAKAFIDEHKAELRGAMVIEVESLGFGYLASTSEEGQFRKMQASSRIKRFTRGAAEATGIVLEQVKTATDSITTTFQKAGMQAMHIMGVEDGRPALKGSADDIVENVDELVLEENINYLMELLKQD